MKRRIISAGSLAIIAALVLSGCGLTPYQDVRYEAMFTTGGEAQLSSVVTLTPVENDAGEQVGVTPSFVVDATQLVVQAAPGSPEAVVEGVEIDYFWADGTEIQLDGDYRVALSVTVPGGYTCSAEGCFGDPTRLPAHGEPATSATFMGMPFGVAESIYFGTRPADNVYAIATVQAYAGARDVSFETDPISVVQEVVQE